MRLLYLSSKGLTNFILKSAELAARDSEDNMQDQLGFLGFSLLPDSFTRLYTQSNLQYVRSFVIHQGLLEGNSPLSSSF